MKTNSRITSISILFSCSLFLVQCNTSTESKESDAPKNTVDSSTLVKYNDYQPIEDTLAVIDSIVGLLNNDDLQDYILVCKSIHESDTEYDEYDRKSFIYLGQENGVYYQHSSNVGAILCKNCGGIFGDPYQGITIETKKGFSIDHYGGSNYRWGILSTFLYDSISNNWSLELIENSSFSAFEPDKIETTTATRNEFGTVYFQNFDVNLYRE